MSRPPRAAFLLPAWLRLCGLFCAPLQIAF
nr:MAG TPA: hypothetical protein [Caudoviricetes sp.]